MKESTALSVFSYQDHPLTFTVLDGVPIVPARDIEAALGYEPKGLANSIADWQAAGLMKEDGSHVRKLTGQDLTLFAVAGSETANSMVRHLLVLTERGLYRVLMLSRKPAALAFQDWLETQVLPSIARHGSYNADKRIDALEARILAMEPRKKRADPKTCQDAELIALVRDWVGDKQLFLNREVLAGLGIKPCQHQFNRIGSALRALGYRRKKMQTNFRWSTDPTLKPV